jgi:O-antigen/teichoic acid export membrane protein
MENAHLHPQPCGGKWVDYSVAVASGAERETPDVLAPLRPSHIVELAKQTFVYGLSGVALQLVGVITLPILARVFTRSEYGKLEIATALLAVGLAIADGGFASAAQRSYYDYTSEQTVERRTVIGTALLTTTLLGAFVAAVFVLVRHAMATSLFGRASAVPLVVAVALSVPLVNTATFLREALRLEFRAWHYVASSMLASVIAGALGVLAVVVFDLHVRGVFVGIIVGSLLSALYAAFVLRRDIGRDYSPRELRTMLRYGTPLIAVGVGAWALTLVDRIMLEQLGSLAAVGEYAVANRVANVLLLGVSGFALAFGPYIFSLYSQNRDLERIVRAQTLRYVTIGLASVGLVLALFAREIIAVIAPAFGSAYKAVGLLAIAMVVYGMSTVTMAGISYVRRTELLAIITIGAASLNIGLNFVLIPPFGMVGAAVANLAAYVLLTGLYYWVAQRLYPTPYELRKLLTIIALATALGVLGVIPIHPLFFALIVKSGAVVAFVGLLRVTHIVMPEEIDRLRDLIGSVRRIAAQRA